MKDCKVFLTTKKGTQKGTKDVYVVKQDGTATKAHEGVIGIHMDSRLISGGFYMNPETSVIFANPSRIIIDPLHSLIVIPEEEVCASDAEFLSKIITHSNELSKLIDEAKSMIDDAAKEISDIKSAVADNAKTEIKSFTDAIQEFFGPTERKTKETDKENHKDDAQHIINELQSALSSMFPGASIEVKQVSQKDLNK